MPLRTAAAALLLTLTPPPQAANAATATCEHDRLRIPTRSSAALRAQKAPFYGPRAKLEAIVVPGTGHVLNVHRTASGWFAKARDWADRRAGGAAR
ncbi:hypothetical protein ACTMTI_50095 [Nonomuraea sp. H19]|uniref:hypothetical protein n=1 Tax=Nonomuraea sp. H19 TaxID=3452206 RepID=UPI003F8C6091